MKTFHILLLVLAALKLTSVMLILFSEKWRTRINKKLTGYRNGIWIAPVAIWFLYLTLSLVDWSWEPEQFIKLVIYFLTPTLLLQYATKNKKSPGILDIIAMLTLWLPFDLRLLNFSWPVLRDFGYHTTAIIAVIYALITFPGFRKINIYARWKLTQFDIFSVVLLFYVLTAIMMPLGTSLHFLKFGFNNFFRTAIWMVPVYFITIFLSTALPEELLFRGIIQNVLSRRLTFIPTLIATSVIFGLAHINNTVRLGEYLFPVPDWTYVGMATIAGFFYGFVFHWRRSLLAAIALHTLVDFTWVMFLRG